MHLSSPHLSVSVRKDPVPRLAIIEDQGLYNDLIATVCRHEFQADIVVRATHGLVGLSEVIRERPDLVLLDVSLPDVDGLAIAKAIQAEKTNCRIIVLSALRDPLTFLRIRKLGVHGYMDKSETSVEALREAISLVAAGGRYFSPVMATTLARLHSDPMAFNLILSENEQLVLTLIGNSYTDQEIASTLGLRPATAHSYRRDIMRKLCIHSTPKLIQYAHEMGFARLGSYQAMQESKALF